MTSSFSLRPAMFALSLAALALPLAGPSLVGTPDEPGPPAPRVLAGENSHEAALVALPPHRRDKAAIVAYTPEGTFETLRGGIDQIFCIADAPGNDRFSISCHPASLWDYLERSGRLSAAGDEARGRTLAEEVRNGTLALPAGATSHLVSGVINPATGVPDSVVVWSEIALPFATPETTGLETRDAGEAPYLMSAGRYSAHVMVDTRRVAWNDLAGASETDTPRR